MTTCQPRLICLFCRHQRKLVSRRSLHSSSPKPLEAVSLRSEDNEFLVKDATHDSYAETGAGKMEEGAPSEADLARRSRLQRGVEEVREALLDFESLVKRRDMRIEVLRNLSNPWPGFQQQHARKTDNSSKDALELPEAGAAPVPHSVFRQRMRSAVGTRAVRLLIRLQLLRCEWPREILRVVAVAMQSHGTAKHLSMLQEPVMRALYRCRNNVSDPKVLSTINIIVSRLTMAGITTHEPLINMGLKFACRSRQRISMARYLRMYRERGMHMSSNVFRSVIAKFSIGHRGLGEIRNGRWRRSDLMQVLTGFEGCEHLLPDQQYHLGTFLQRDDWQYLHGWIAVLARCRASDVIWEEWEHWKQSDARNSPKKLASMERNMNTRVRGDYWFVEQMSYTGDQNRAWNILEETEIPFSFLKRRVKNFMLDEVERISIWTPQISEAMLWKYDAELAKIEQALGVVWEPTDEHHKGRHVLFRDQEGALDELGAATYKREENFGFPYDETPIVSMQERPLHDAAEGALASNELEYGT